MKGSANNPIDVRELMRENAQLKRRRGIGLFLTFLFGAACMTTGVIVGHTGSPPPAVCDRNHVEYDTQGRPHFMEYCDKENGRCYTIIDSKIVMKQICKHGRK